MTPHDLRDDALIERTVAAVRNLLLAVHRSDAKQVIAAVNELLAAALDHRDACAERVSDEPLRRAIGRLG